MLNDIWQNGLDFFISHLPVISPFWKWLLWGFIVSAVLCVIGWGFPVLRTFCAAVIISIAMGLTGYQMGWYDAKAQYQPHIVQRR